MEKLKLRDGGCAEHVSAADEYVALRTQLVTHLAAMRRAAPVRNTLETWWTWRKWNEANLLLHQRDAARLKLATLSLRDDRDNRFVADYIVERLDEIQQERTRRSIQVMVDQMMYGRDARRAALQDRLRLVPDE